MQRADIKTVKTRNHYIDFCRGVAVINVIFIHTVWWSGNSYVPDYLRTLSLLFEVPVFFFLAGWSYSYTNRAAKALRNLWHLHLHYLIFLVIFMALLFTLQSNSLTLHNILAWSLYNHIPPDKFQVVMGSFWFISVYISVVLLCITLIKYLTRRQLLYSISLFAGLILFFQLASFKIIGGILDIIRPDFIIFYSIFYILGYVLRNVYFRHWILAPILIVLVATLLISIGISGRVNVLDIQNLKFPPTIVYLLWSLPGIILIIAFKKRFENMSNNLTAYIGANAIFIYFAQGISSSLLYYNLALLHSLPWLLQLVLNFSFNIGMAFTLAIVIKQIILTSDNWLSKKLSRAFSRNSSVI